MKHKICIPQKNLYLTKRVSTKRLIKYFKTLEDEANFRKNVPKETLLKLINNHKHHKTIQTYVGLPNFWDDLASI